MNGPHPSLDAREHAVFEKVCALIHEFCPLREDPYALSLRPLPEAERSDWYAQEGPVLFDSSYFYASLHFDGVTHGGDPWEIDGIVRLYARHEEEPRALAMVKAFFVFSKRLMKDVQNMRLGPGGWLGLVHLSGAMMDLLKAPAKKVQTFEQCMGVLLSSKQVRGLVMPEDEVLTEAVNALDAWCASRQVVYGSPRVEVSVVAKPSWNGPFEISEISPHGVEVNRKGIYLTLRLMLLDSKGQIDDLKEQQVPLLAMGELSDATRMCACLEGWARVLPRVIEKWGYEKLQFAMPMDLFDAGAVRLKKPVAVEDFVRVFERRMKV